MINPVRRGPARIAFLHGGSHAALATLADPALLPYRMEPLHVRTGDPAGLAGVEVVIVADRLRPDLLVRWVEAVRDRLDAGATVVVFGENDLSRLLPGVGLAPRETNFWWWRTGEDAGIRRTETDHPADAFFSDRALIWHFHGALAPPAGAVSLVDLHLPDGSLDGSLLYIDEVSSAGRLLVTTMDPVYHHGSGFMPGATQLLYSTLHWATR